MICVDINVLVENGWVIDVMWIDKVVLIILKILEKGGKLVLFVYFG